MSENLSWEQVKKAHGTVAAISFDGDDLKSILSGGVGHEDIIDDNFIIYAIPNRNYYKKTIDRFHKSMIKKNKVRVFLKVSQNSWIDKGDYFVELINQTEKKWDIRLVAFETI